VFGKNKEVENRYVIAIKNINETVKAIRDGSMPLYYNRDIYIKLIDSAGESISSIKELDKFIKLNGKVKKEVYHFWKDSLPRDTPCSMFNTRRKRLRLKICAITIP